MAYIHIVTFKWREDGFDASAIAEALRGLAARLDGVQSYLCGPDVGHAPGAYDFAVVGTFDDADHFAAYQDHPEHQRIASEMVRPNLETRTFLQIEA